jgi:hypothetical protein
MQPKPLFQQWVRVGVQFPAFEPSSEEPHLEELIANTSVVGRYEPRLIECMAGWITKHGELINTSLMHKHLSGGDSAVLGLLFELVESKDALKVKQLLKYCKPKKKAEMLFYAAENSPTMKAKAIENETKLNKKWNLFFASLRLKTDAVVERKQILRDNPNLARRALFGVQMRTEILNFLLRNGSSFPGEIAKQLGYQYHRIFEDIQDLIRDGVVMDSQEGKKRILRISPPFEKYLNLLPY